MLQPEEEKTFSVIKKNKHMFYKQMFYSTQSINIPNRQLHLIAACKP